MKVSHYRNRKMAPAPAGAAKITKFLCPVGNNFRAMAKWIFLMCISGDFNTKYAALAELQLVAAAGGRGRELIQD